MKKPILKEINYDWKASKIIECMIENQTKLLEYIDYIEKSENVESCETCAHGVCDGCQHDPPCSSDGKKLYYEPIEQVKNCSTCKHELVAALRSPCSECNYFNDFFRWEPKD